ncbi:hypothetical protein [Amycolatopsis thailandensis]|uniref:hypothetical protein n=1 Tax=Amycolatopsis thailandensis TaxID=589330 RepID=UPI00362FF82C
MNSPGVTPDQLLHDFRTLVGAQKRSLRGLAIASGIGHETIRGWKDGNRFPRNTDDFLKVVRTCLNSLKEDVPAPRWNFLEWEIRYQEAKRAWENQADDSRSTKTAPRLSGGPSLPPTIQVHGGDYVAGVKNSIHFGDANHNHNPQ